jgi:hypothetical protein
MAESDASAIEVIMLGVFETGKLLVIAGWDLQPLTYASRVRHLSFLSVTTSERDGNRFDRCWNDLRDLRTTKSSRFKSLLSIPAVPLNIHEDTSARVRFPTSCIVEARLFK